MKPKEPTTSMEYSELINCSWATMLAQALMEIQIQESIRISNQESAAKFRKRLSNMFALSLHRCTHFDTIPDAHEVLSRAGEFLDAAEIKWTSMELLAMYMILEEKVKSLLINRPSMNEVRH